MNNQYPQAANDVVGALPIPAMCCGMCQNWRDYTIVGGGQPALGQCYVRRGELPIYTPWTRACDVEIAGRLLFKPFPVTA